MAATSCHVGPGVSRHGAGTVIMQYARSAISPRGEGRSPTPDLVLLSLKDGNPYPKQADSRIAVLRAVPSSHSHMPRMDISRYLGSASP